MCVFEPLFSAGEHSHTFCLTAKHTRGNKRAGMSDSLDEQREETDSLSLALSICVSYCFLVLFSASLSPPPFSFSLTPSSYLSLLWSATAAAEIGRHIYIYIFFFICFREAAEGSDYSQMVILNFTTDPLRSLFQRRTVWATVRLQCAA